MEGNKWLELNSSSTRIGQAQGQQPAAAPPPEPEQTPEPERSGAGLSTGAKAGLAATAVVLLGLSGFIAFNGSEEEPDATAAPSNETEQLAFADGVEGDADGEGQDGSAADGDTASDVNDAGSNDTDIDSDADGASPVGADSPPSPPGAPDVHAILSGGKIYLRGSLPSEALEAPIVSAVEQVLGEGNVISEYSFDPNSPYVPGASSPVYIAETVLFETASAEIWPDFYPLLGLGVTLLAIQDGVTIEIVGHTDSQGSDAANLQLSQARVEAVKAWMVAQGADPARLVATGKGESAPIADNATPEGRQANRRVEFIISGFEY